LKLAKSSMGKGEASFEAFFFVHAYKFV